MNKKSVDLSNGEKYFYIEKGTGNETVIFIHGNMSSGVHYKPLIERFGTDYHIFAPDLRGFGDSSYNKNIESLEDLSDDLFDFITQLNIKKTHLVGWSTGGAIALKLAAKYPELIGNIVLIESASYKGYPIFKKDAQYQPIIGSYYDSKEELALDAVQVLPALNAMKNQDYATIKYIWDFAIYNVNKPSDSDDYLFLTETLKQRNLVDIDYALTTFNMSNTHNGVSQGDNSIKDVVSKVLTIWSEFDLVVPEYMIDETMKELKDVKKVIFKNSGHSPLIDCPDELEKMIIDFFK